MIIFSEFSPLDSSSSRLEEVSFSEEVSEGIAVLRVLNEGSAEISNIF